MVIQDIEKRSNYWGSNYYSFNQGNSIPTPFVWIDNWPIYFSQKDVLEIGAGEGRQYAFCRDGVNSYSIADISMEVLSNDMYKECLNRFLIRDYDEDFGIKFDTIHFWYVLHHVLREELYCFFGFISRHLKENGFVLFNTPYLDWPSEVYKCDGMDTTDFSLREVMECSLYHNFEFVLIDGRQRRESNGHIVLLRKKE